MSLGCWGLCYRKNIKASAICQYAFSDVQKVFEGPYMEVQDSKWREYTGKVPDPRPGSVSFNALTFSSPSSAIVMFCIFSHFFCLYLQCISDLHRSQNINSSRDLPDNVLTFARRHPLMAKQVHPIGVRPLMFKRSVNYVKIAVHKEPALDGNIYTVLFLGTGEFHTRNSIKWANKLHICI